MQTKNITDMKHEWANGCKARSQGSDQVLITRTELQVSLSLKKGPHTLHLVKYKSLRKGKGS